MPIYPFTADFFMREQKCSRTQFPLLCGFAISIHTSQGKNLDNFSENVIMHSLLVQPLYFPYYFPKFPIGKTLGKCLVDISDQEFACGITYTGCSRVRRMEDIAFKPMYSHNRFVSVERFKAFKERVIIIIILIIIIIINK